MSLSETFIGSAHFDGIVRLWSVKSGDSVCEIKNAHDDLISCVRFTHDEKYFVSTSK